MKIPNLPGLGIVLLALLALAMFTARPGAKQSTTDVASVLTVTNPPPRINIESVSVNWDSIGTCLATDSQTGAQWLMIFDRRTGHLSLAPLVKP